LGKKQYLDVLKKHPLNRALRVDKMTLAALEATLRSYEAGTPEEIPVAAMLGAKPEALRNKAEALLALLTEAGVAAQIVPTHGQVGGGSVPMQALPSFAVALTGDVNALEAALRAGLHPIVGRIHEGRYLLDVRTLREEDFPIIVGAIRELIGNGTVFSGTSFVWHIPHFEPMTLFLLPAGGFFVLGFVIALVNALRSHRKAKQERKENFR